MPSKTIIQQRLTFYQNAYEKLQTAYLKLSGGGVKSYTIDDRTLTNADTGDILKEMEAIEKKIDEYTAMLEGGSARKAVGVVPRDW